MPFDGSHIKESDATKVLKNARKLITNPKNHCIGVDERIRQGVRQYCAVGALSAATYKLKLNDYSASYVEAIHLLSEQATFRGVDPCHHIRITSRSTNIQKVVGHNNGLGHGPTLEMFDKAIAASICNDMRS